MMNLLKKNFALLLAVVLCLGLAACFGSNGPDVCGADWRTWGIVCDSGTITRDGEDTDVLVCVHKADATFYYDTENQVLFGSVDYPITLEGDAWEMFQGIDFADLNGDGNSDVTMRFDDGGSEIVLVWYWDAESVTFVYQPDESQLGEDEGLGDLIGDDGSAALVLMCDALPFANMENLQSETHEDGTYYYMDVADVTESGQIFVVNTAVQSHRVYDVQTVDDYLAACALDLSGAITYDSLTIEENAAYTGKMTYPVYIVTYTAGGNEDTREWIIFAMDTDSHTYLYGLCATVDAADDAKAVYQDIFDGLYMSDGE